MEKQKVFGHEATDDIDDLEKLERELIDLQESGALDDVCLPQPQARPREAEDAEAAWRHLRGERTERERLRHAWAAVFDDRSTLGSLLNAARSRAGMDVQRAARLLRIHAETLSRLETGCTASIEDVAHLMEALEITMPQIDIVLLRDADRSSTATWRAGLESTLRRWGRSDLI
jgi:hypothetical protein